MIELQFKVLFVLTCLLNLVCNLIQSFDITILVLISILLIVLTFVCFFVLLFINQVASIFCCHYFSLDYHKMSSTPFLTIRPLILYIYLDTLVPVEIDHGFILDYKLICTFCTKTNDAHCNLM